MDAGTEVKFPYPFSRTEFTQWSEDGPSRIKSWRPGTRPIFLHPGDFEHIADGMGQQVCTIVSIHKPGRFPERTFYTREWIDPTGKRFGKPGLRILTTRAFKALCRGYRHEFRMATESDPGPEDEQ